MKSSQLVWTAIALWAAAGATSAFACDQKASGASAAAVNHCSGKGMSAAAAGCPAHSAGAAACKGAAGATAAMSHCHGDGWVKVADASAHGDCDGCTDMARCAQEMSNAGARVQVVPLKNGVMYVYTAESSAGVHTVQAAVSRRSERFASWLNAGDRVHLCSECKAMRGAAASGKLNRQIVNIEGGCLTLMTSSDPAIVAHLHDMASASLTSARTKS